MSLRKKEKITSKRHGVSIQQSSTNLSTYVTMPDGIKIAVEIWLPTVHAPGCKVPVMIEFTRYWRALEGKAPRDRVLHLVNLGFAHAVADCRGSGASFGDRPAEQSETEISDFAHVINWLAEQSWSNGNVASIGSSYSGNTAEFAMIDAPLALKASIPRFTDFDFFTNLAFPGGLLNKVFLEPWGKGIHDMDLNVVGDDIHPQWEDYRHISVKPVEDDIDKVCLNQAVSGHKNNVSIEDFLGAIEYRDEYNFTKAIDKSCRPLSLHLMQRNARLSQIPSYHWASFNDAGTAAGAIARFMGSEAPMRVVIGWWSHGGKLDTNPYKPRGDAASPQFDEQIAHIAMYLAELKCSEGGAVKRIGERSLYYYTAGEECWKRTETWPPNDVYMQRLYLSARRLLSPIMPNEKVGKDQYCVDFEAGTGVYNRWNQMVPEVDYGDRADPDKRLLVYTSEPLPQTTEVTGHPVIRLHMSSTRIDGAVIVYLEDVAPNGVVTMLTEGGIRLIHRKVSNDTPPYPMFGPYHTFERKDALPMKIGDPVEIGFDLLPLSIRIEKGHSLRVAIAGNDKDCFAPVSYVSDLIYEFYRNSEMASYIDIPMKHIENPFDLTGSIDPFY